MEHSERYSISAREIKDVKDFANAIGLVVEEALLKFEKERKPWERSIDYATTHIICGYDAERNAICVDVSASEFSFLKKVNL